LEDFQFLKVVFFTSWPLTLFHAALGLLAQANYDLTPHEEGYFKKFEKNM
jgi:hypothetical protein